MISAPRDIFGPNVFQIFVHELGMNRVSKILEVTPATIRRWMRGTTPVPRMAVLALYWETRYGRSLIESDMVNEIRLLYQRNRLLLDQFRKAKDMVTGLRSLHAGTANEPIFEELIEFHEIENFQTQFGAPRSREHSSPVASHQASTVSGVSTKPEANPHQAVPTIKKTAAA